MERKQQMKIVIQCAGTKTSSASFRNALGPICFVAAPDHLQNERAPWDTVYGTTWIEWVRRFNKEHVLPSGVSIVEQFSRAASLYKNNIYARLTRQIGIDNIFILSAGWGLVPGNALIPTYNVTFSAKAEKNAKISPTKRSEYPSLLENPNFGEEDVHFFITPSYRDYWDKAFPNQKSKKYVFHERDGISAKTNWHYEALKQWLDTL
jgi:hypothetical protein